MRQVGHLPELYEDVRSEKILKKVLHNTYTYMHRLTFKNRASYI